VTNSIRILQITDCHLSASPELAYRGINSHESLQLLLEKVLKFSIDFKPDFVLATGDLSEDGSIESYLRLQEYLGQFDIPVLALPGNHDEPGLLAATYPTSPVDNIEISEHGQWQLIRLNTCLEGTPAGRIKESNLIELEEALTQNANRPRLIALHHQPVPVGSPWIDKYALQEPEDFLQLIDHCEGVKAAVWGHVHQAFAEDRNGVAFMAGPSTARNCVPGAQQFTVDNAGSACRWLELMADGAIRNGIFR
jgi:Icc protein